MNKIIVSLFLIFLVGCSAKVGSTKDPATDVITPDEIADCIVKVDTELPEQLDLSENKIDKIEVSGETVTMSKKDFLSVQQLLLKLKNRIYELQEIVKDSRK